MFSVREDHENQRISARNAEVLLLFCVIMETEETDMKKTRIRFNAPVTLGFVSVCFVATILGMLTQGKATRLLFMTYRTSCTDFMMYVRLFTHVFGHAGWQHFIGNASYLLLLGPMLEEKYGSKVLVKVIAVTAVVTGIVNNIFFPSVALCGASGVVFSFILLSSFTGFKEGEIPLTFLLVAVLFIGQQIIQGLTMQNDISNMAHIIGGMIGSMAGYSLNRRK